MSTYMINSDQQLFHTFNGSSYKELDFIFLGTKRPDNCEHWGIINQIPVDLV